MIKVKQTFQHQGHVVCKGKLVLIEFSIKEVDRKSQVLWKNKSGDLLYTHSASNDIIPLKPIIISETEEIEVGDKFVTNRSLEGIKMYQLTKINNRQSDHSLKGWLINENSLMFHPNDCKKIIALSEHFSPEQLQMIVDDKLKDGDEVMVECEEFVSPMGDGDISHIKLNQQNHVLIIK